MPPFSAFPKSPLQFDIKLCEAIFKIDIAGTPQEMSRIRKLTTLKNKMNRLLDNANQFERTTSDAKPDNKN